MDQVESPFTDFYLSCNWIFRPDAVAEFLEEMRKLPTVRYHLQLFHVWCTSLCTTSLLSSPMD